MLLLIWADEKYNTQKNPGVFHRPKHIPFGQNVRPQKILRTPPSLKYVSGAPGKAVNLKTKMGALFSLAKTEIILASK